MLSLKSCRIRVHSLQLYQFTLSMLLTASSKALLAISRALSVLPSTSWQSTLRLSMRPSRTGLVEVRLLRAQFSPWQQMRLAQRRVSSYSQSLRNQHMQRRQSAFIFKKKTLPSIVLTFGSRLSSSSFKTSWHRQVVSLQMILRYFSTADSTVLLAFFSSLFQTACRTLSSARLFPTASLNAEEKSDRYWTFNQGQIWTSSFTKPIRSENRSVSCAILASKSSYSFDRDIIKYSISQLAKHSNSRLLAATPSSVPQSHLADHGEERESRRVQLLTGVVLRGRVSPSSKDCFTNRLEIGDKLI